MSDEKKLKFVVQATFEVEGKTLTDAISTLGYTFDYRDDIELQSISAQQILPDDNCGAMEMGNAVEEIKEMVAKTEEDDDVPF